MRRLLRELRRAADYLDAEDDPSEPSYDPAHLAAVLIGTLAVAGILFWLLWTLLVYEGGLWAKVGPAFEVLLGRKTPGDFGYRAAPYEMGVFQGWAGNLAALALSAAAFAGLHRLYRAAAKRSSPR